MADHGIPARDLETIRTVLATCREDITRVDLFGSRANGRHRPNSDIDLVLHGDVSRASIARLWTLFHESLLPVSVDVVSYEAVRDRPLGRHIDAVRRPLFAAAEIRRELGGALPGMDRSDGES